MDYWPRRLDLAALKAGNLAEVLNLAPWGGVLLQLPPAAPVRRARLGRAGRRRSASTGCATSSARRCRAEIY